MKKVIHILFYLALIAFTPQKGVAQNFEWLQTIGAAGDEAVNTIAVDAEGNYYITGRFSSTVDFGDGTTRTSDENEDAFFAKYTRAGKLVFVRQFSSVRSNGTSIRIDNKGNIYVSGVYREELTFEGTTQKLTSSSTNANDIFITKYSANGDFVFACKIGGAGNDTFPFFDVDTDENIYITGVFEKPISFFSSNQEVASEKKDGIGGQDVFLAKYSNTGILTFVKQIGGSSDENPNALGLDGQNNIYITGAMTSDNFDPDENIATNNNLKSTNENGDVFIIKYDKSGKYLTGKNMGGTGTEGVNGMHVSTAGEVYLTGQTDKEADFDPDAGKVIIGAHNQDIFLAKYFSDLKIAFARSFGSTDEQQDRGREIAVDQKGRIYITGFFTADALNLDPNSKDQFKNSGGEDGFWAVFDASAENLLFSRQIGGAEDDTGKDIVVDPLGNIYIVGEFRSEITFEARQSRTSKGERDIFVLKYLPEPVAPQVTTLSPTEGPVGTALTITGEDFGSDATKVQVKFGAVATHQVTAAQLTSPSEITFPVPDIPENTYPVSVVVGTLASNNDKTFTVTPDDIPVISSLSATSAPPGTSITISGDQFGTVKGMVKVFFDETEIPATGFTLNSDTEIEVTVPDLAPGTYKIKVTVGGKPSGELGFTITEIGTPVISSLSAASGAPGSKITISGQNFGTDASAISVTFNETDVTFALKSDTEIEVTVPNVDGGLYKIKITKSGLASNEEDFTISGGSDTPAISNIDPNSIKVGETPALIITGTGFGNNKDNITVSFKDINDESTTVNSGISVNNEGTEISFPAPSGLLAGAYTVSITVSGKSSGNLSFTVQGEGGGPTPVITDFSPFAKAEGEMEITGNNFGTDTNNTTVTFIGNGLSAAGSIINLANDKITVETPDNLTEGEFNIRVIVNGNQVTSTNKIVIDNTKPTVTASGIPASEYFVPGAVKVMSIAASDESSGVSVVNLRYFGIREETGSAKSESFTDNSDGTYTIDIQSLSINDVLGMEYFFEVTDKAGNLSRFPEASNLFLHKDQQSMSIQAAKARDADKPTTSDYNLVALPLVDLRRDQVFGSLGAFGGGADKNWWLFAYNESYTEVSSSASIEPGKGYMLIFRDAATIQPEGKVVSVTPDNPVKITLAPGPNLIGNPFPFDISWNTVLASDANKDVPGIDQLGPLRSFNQGNWPESSQLSQLKGALIFNGHTAPVTLEIPYKNNAGGRLSQDTIKNKHTPLDHVSWEVPLMITTGERYATGGVGMDKDAEESYDPSDDFTAPRFIDHLELNFYHPEFFYSKFTKDIVPTQDAYTWEFEVASNLSSPEVTIHWDNQYFGNNEQTLMLLDLYNHQIIDMREVTAYTFSVVEGTREFKIFFGNEDKVKANMMPESIAVGEAYPNPMQGQLTIPVSLPNSSHQLSVEIYNTLGQLVKRTSYDNLSAGYHGIQWDRTDTDGQKVRSGLYFYRLKVNDAQYDGRIIAW